MLFRSSVSGLQMPIDPALLEASTDELVALLEDAAFPRRVGAACVLARRGDVRAFETLVAALEDKRLRYRALESLRLLGDERAIEPVRPLLGRLLLGTFDRTAAAGVLARLGDAAGREHLLARLKKRRRDDDRGLAIELVAEVGLDEGLEELQRIAATRGDLFRGAALKALAAMRPKDTLPALCEVLADEADDTDVRADAAEALAGLEGPEARAALEAARSSGDGELAAVVAGLLAD